MSPEVTAALIAAISGLLGATVGGVLSLVATRAVERRRWEREDAARFHAERRRAYHGLMAAVSRLSRSVAADQPHDHAVEEAFTDSLADIEILASRKVRERADEFAFVAYYQLIDREETSADDWIQARSALIEAIREELGVEATKLSGSGRRHIRVEPPSSRLPGMRGYP